MHTHRIARLAAFVVAFAPAVAGAQTLTFDDVTTNAQGLNQNFSTYNGFIFEGFNVATTTSLGSGTNAVSGTKFALGREDFSSVYRVGTDFHFLGASLSYRQFDTTNPDNGPIGVNVFGYRVGIAAPVFTQFVTLTNTAQAFQFNFTNIEEVVFETEALTAGGRSSALALDNAQVAVVPEPSTVLLLTVGLAGVLLVVQRKVGLRR
jgi:hypothetical protein